MKVIIVALFTCSVLSFAVAAQVVPDFSTVKTEKGMMVLNNNKVQPFSFLVPGSDPNGKQDVDGSLVISTAANKCKNKGCQKNDQTKMNLSGGG